MIFRKIFLFFLMLLMTMSSIIGDKSMACNILSKKQENIVLIASYSAKGDIDNLKMALEKGLDEGLSVSEIKEILVQIYAYCGFPRSLNALNTFKEITESKTNLKEGETAQILPKKTNKFAYGDKVQVELTGGHVKGGVFDFAPAIDKFLKEHLFADIFSRGVLTYQEREIATLGVLSTLEGVDSQLKSHIACALNTGLTQEQVDKILDLTKSSKSGAFVLGDKNDAYAQYFKGQSYISLLTKEGVNTANVTFEPGCRNNWHIHHKGGQILLVTSGKGYYQEWGKEAQELKKGDVVNIPAEVKHWHGAFSNSWFSHIAIAIPAQDSSTEWLEEVSDEEYNKL